MNSEDPILECHATHSLSTAPPSDNRIRRVTCERLPTLDPAVGHGQRSTADVDTSVPYVARPLPARRGCDRYMGLAEERPAPRGSPLLGPASRITEVEECRASGLETSCLAKADAEPARAEERLITRLI